MTDHKWFVFLKSQNQPLMARKKI